MGDQWERLARPIHLAMGDIECCWSCREARPGDGRAWHGISQQLAAFDLRMDRVPLVADFDRLYALASLHRLTAYDVAYLDLAMRLTLPLATRDPDLVKAARAEGIGVL